MMEQQRKVSLLDILREYSTSPSNLEEAVQRACDSDALGEKEREQLLKLQRTKE